MHPILTGLWKKRRIISFYACLIVFGWFLGGVLRDVTIPEMQSMNPKTVQLMVMSAFALFVVLAAIPFVPGAEVGFTLLFIFGAHAAPLVYFGMVGSLTVSYIIARVVPAAALIRTLAWFGLQKAADLVSDLDAVPPKERLDVLLRRAPNGVGQNIIKHRYLFLAVALNTPGNSLLGGGGGLAFVAGASRLFAFWPFIATIVCAVAPVPLFFYLR